MISAVMLFILYALVFYYAFHFICRRLKRYLHGLQQDDYNNQRFINWLVAVSYTHLTLPTTPDV